MINSMFVIIGLFSGFVAGPICYNVFRILYDNWKESKLSLDDSQQRLFNYKDHYNRILWNVYERQNLREVKDES